MTLRNRLRPLLTAILLFIHAHSLVFFVGFLCVSSNDLANIPTTSTANPLNLTAISTKLNSNLNINLTTTEKILTTSTQTTAESIDDSGEKSIEPTLLTNPQDESEKWRDFDIQHANNDDLRDYKQYLELQLANVTQLLDGVEKKSKRYIPLPVSSSLPDYISSDFILGRLNASKKAEKNETEESEIDGAKRDDSEHDENLEKTDQKSTEKVSENESKTSDNSELAIVRDENEPELKKAEVNESSILKHKAFGVQTTHLTEPQQPEEETPKRSSFEPTQNHTSDECRQLTQAELVTELKQKGSYNPNLMAWDVSGVFRFLDRSIVDQYERQFKSHRSNKQAVQRNIDALERILTELNLNCNVRSPEVLSRLNNLTSAEPRRTVMSPSLRIMSDEEVRFKRHTLADDLLKSFNNSRKKDDPPPSQSSKKHKMIGDVHVVPFGCDKRGEEEDGYLRLCGACQAIRKLPDSFFPPFINEVMCDEDRSCLYFYEYPHGKCKQKHMNFVVLRNVGTPKCQVWQKFNLNVRVSCECFVDEMSFFAKYV